MSLNSITASLISMQNSLKSASSLTSAKNVLKTEATIYAPSYAFKGDPQKEAALNDRANNIDKKINNIFDDVKKKITDLNNQDPDKKDTAVGQAQTDDSKTAQSSGSTAKAEGDKLVKSTIGNVQAQNNTEMTKDDAKDYSAGPIGGNLDVIV